MRKKYKIFNPSGKLKLEIACCDDDDWFYEVIEHPKKKKADKWGNTLGNSMILQKDVQSWLSQYKRKGFSVREEDI